MKSNAHVACGHEMIGDFQVISKYQKALKDSVGRKYSIFYLVIFSCNIQVILGLGTTLGMLAYFSPVYYGIKDLLLMVYCEEKFILVLLAAFIEGFITPSLL